MPRAARPTRPTLAILGLLLLAAGILLQHAGHGTITFYDEWDFVTKRRGITADSLLRGHNGHFSVFPVAVYKVLLQGVGLEVYWPYRLVLVLLHLTTAVLLFVLVRGRVGDTVALCATGLLLFLGSAGEDLLWAFQIGFVGSVTAGLAMLICLDRGTRAGDIAASVLLFVSLGCSSLGVPFAVLVLVQLLIERDWRRLARVAAVPLLLYAAWRLEYGESDLTTSNLDDAPAYAFAMLSAAVAGMTGLGGAVGPTLGLAVLVGIAWSIARTPPSPRLIGIVVAATSLWGLTALGRAQLNDPGASRYIYLSAVLLMLVAVELWPKGWTLRGRTLAVVLVGLSIAVLGNLLSLNKIAGGYRANTWMVLPQLTALELAGDAAPDDFRPALQGAPQVFAKPYLSAVAEFGSPALTEAELLDSGELHRAYADGVFAQIVPPLASVVRPPTDVAECRVVAAQTDVDLPRAGSVTFVDTRDRQGVTFRVHRFADTPPPTTWMEVGDGGALRVETSSDKARQPWRVLVSAPVRVCGG